MAFVLNTITLFFYWSSKLILKPSYILITSFIYFVNNWLINWFLAAVFNYTLRLQQQWGDLFLLRKKTLTFSIKMHWWKGFLMLNNARNLLIVLQISFVNYYTELRFNNLLGKIFAVSMSEYRRWFFVHILSLLQCFRFILNVLYILICLNGPLIILKVTFLMCC
jgi:hypothetical protein